MRILALLSLDIFRLSIGWALEELGHQVYYLNELREDLFVRAIQDFKPDLLFDMGWDVEHCDPAKLDLLARLITHFGLYHVYFAEEDWLHFERWSKPYVEKVKPQFVFTRATTCMTEYKGMGFKTAYLDVGCNPYFHRPVPVVPAYLSELTVVANAQLVWDIFRRKSVADLVVPLLSAPYQVHLWGRDWNQVGEYFGATLVNSIWHGVLPYVETPRVYSSAAVNLSIQSVEDQISNRTYDILATGGFLLTSDTSGVRERLTPGVNCDVSASSQETLEKVRFYLSHLEIRQKIAERGREHALQTRSYQVTLPRVWPLVEADFRNYRRGIRLASSIR